MEYNAALKPPLSVKTMTPDPGVMVVSLDLELFWGFRSSTTLADYTAPLKQVRSIVPRLLDLFAEYQIHATWATVGFVFFERRQDLMRGLPAAKPDYQNARLNPYPYLENIGAGER